MKTCLLILISLFAFAFMPAKEQEPKNYFYFCVSKSTGDINSSAGKQQVLYSGIHQIIMGEPAIKAKAREWETWVSTRCASQTPCTSDFNYYPTREEAKIQYGKFLESYSDTTKFILQKVKFQ